MSERSHQYLPKTLIPLRFIDTFVPVEKRGLKPIHIGKIIRTKMEQMSLAPGAIQKKMKISKALFYYYTDKPTMDTGMLERFSQAIGYNFFLEYLTELERGGKAADILRQQLAATDAELREVKDKLMKQYEIALKKTA